MTAIGYVRRSESTADTAKKRGGAVVSLEVQADAIQAETARQGWTLAAVVTEDGVSGGRRDRLQRLAVALQTHRAQVLVVYHQDRLARDLAGLLDAVRAWGRRGIGVWVVGRGWLDLASSAGFLAGAVEGMVAEHLRLITGEKTRAALARLRTEGRRFSRRPPFGYRYVEGAMLEAPEEQAALALLAAMPTAPPRVVNQAMRESGLAPRSGSQFDRRLIQRLRRRGFGARRPAV